MTYFEFNEKNTFCISLHSNSRRWENMKIRIKEAGIESFTRWKACIGGTKDITSVFQKYMTDGPKGCAQSHVNIWHHLQQNKEIEYALILEDDACFDKKWKEKLENFYADIDCEEKRENWEILLLNASEPINTTNTWVEIREQYLTGGYIISQKGVRYILEMFYNNYGVSDWMTSRLQMRGNSYSYFPWLIIQDGFESTINSDVKADNAKVIRCLKEINYDLDNYII